jgi:hypothetical protein
MPPGKPVLEPLSPEMGLRMLAALDKLYNEQDADEMPSEDNDRIKSNILARIREFGR